MASIFIPTNFGAALGPYRIDLTDCMGDSVSVINANTNYLASYTAAVSSTASTQIASANTRITALSTVPLARLQAGGQTGNAPIFGARAWVNFNGNEFAPSGSENLCTIRGNGNVSKVVRTAEGRYVIYFSTPLTGNYAVTGNCSLQDTNNNAMVMLYRYATPTTTSFGIHLARNSDGDEKDASYVNIIVVG